MGGLQITGKIYRYGDGPHPQVCEKSGTTIRIVSGKTSHQIKPFAAPVGAPHGAPRANLTVEQCAILKKLSDTASRGAPEPAPYVVRLLRRGERGRPVVLVGESHRPGDDAVRLGMELFAAFPRTAIEMMGITTPQLQSGEIFVTQFDVGGARDQRAGHSSLTVLAQLLHLQPAGMGQLQHAAAVHLEALRQSSGSYAVVSLQAGSYVYELTAPHDFANRSVAEVTAQAHPTEFLELDRKPSSWRESLLTYILRPRVQSGLGWLAAGCCLWNLGVGIAVAALTVLGVRAILQIGKPAMLTARDADMAARIHRISGSAADAEPLLVVVGRDHLTDRASALPAVLISTYGFSELPLE